LNYPRTDKNNGYLFIPARSLITAEAHAMPNNAGMYETVPTTEALFLSPAIATILDLSGFSGDHTAVKP
jgi:hypothetical protein